MADKCLVNYSSSSSSDEEVECKRPRKLPPLPESFLSNFKGKSDHVDNPVNHQGRLRSFKHERGNWASFVSIHYPHNLTFILEDIITMLKPDFHFHIVDDLHVSLSRTVVLLYHWIDGLVSDLKSKIANTCKRSILKIGDLEVYTNDEKSRTFIGLKVDSKELINYVHTIDQTLHQFNLPSFYKNADFHISVLWCVGNLKKHISNNILNKIQKTITDYFKLTKHLTSVEVNELRLKTGNKIFIFPIN